MLSQSALTFSRTARLEQEVEQEMKQGVEVVLATCHIVYLGSRL